MNKLGLIVPCYNEEAALPKAIEQIELLYANLIEKKLISQDSFILFIDDGSQDSTWSILSKKKTQNKNIFAIRFSRNFGHQNALLAGLDFCSKNSDFNVCIDADLQHDISKISDFIDAYQKGAHIVLGIKEERNSEPFFKKVLAQFYYTTLKTLGVDIYYNHADFRLMSSQATCELLKFQETNFFLRGIIPMMGFKTDFVNYKVKERIAGVSKYSFGKMISLAWNGITSTTIAPLRFFSILGFIIFIFSLVQSIWVIRQYFAGNVIPGWASTVIPIYFIGSVQLISIGVIGEYIGKIYLETKKRPRYIISNQI
jgi:glycosyltransferase involved in cell wall biosynthesis